ncbi:MAG: pantetheine-phosphate adenylyltransferase [Bacteroidaceae bacterium]|nr:pantetheine-phosphate adenylyltransferase [Bacteroidaceae bacterium]
MEIRHRALFTGTFDPFTKGHENIVRRAVLLTDELIIGIGKNEMKHCLYSVEERLQMISELFADDPKIKVLSYSGLTVDFAKEINAQCIIRGLRCVKDFEYEESMAELNRQLTGIDTLLLFTEPQFNCISSSMVRELISYGKDVSQFLPEGMKIKR